MTKLTITYAMAAICLLQASVLFADTHAFPSDDSTVVGSVVFDGTNVMGHFWSSIRGDLVSETFADPLIYVSHAVFDFEVQGNNLHDGAQVDWDVRINGTTVGSFTIPEGFTGPVSLDLVFPPIANIGGEYTLSFVVTNEVPDGYGAISLRYKTPYVHSVELSDMSETMIDIDIKPGSCPNPFNGKSKGSVPVAIVGTAAFDVTTIDPSTLMLEGVPIVPNNVLIADVTEPDGDPADCYNCFEDDGSYNGDGYPDLVVKFYTQDLAATPAISGVGRDECVSLMLEGFTNEGYFIMGMDSVVIKTKVKD